LHVGHEIPSLRCRDIVKKNLKDKNIPGKPSSETDVNGGTWLVRSHLQIRRSAIKELARFGKKARSMIKNNKFEEVHCQFQTVI